MNQTYVSIYVRKDLLNKRYSNINELKINGVDIKNSNYNSFYDIVYEYTSYVRLIKIYKILKKENPIVDFIEYCYEICSDINDVIETELSEELAKQINKEILKKVKELGNIK